MKILFPLALGAAVCLACSSGSGNPLGGDGGSASSSGGGSSSGGTTGTCPSGCTRDPSHDGPSGTCGHIFNGMDPLACVCSGSGPSSNGSQACVYDSAGLPDGSVWNGYCCTTSAPPTGLAPGAKCGSGAECAPITCPCNGMSTPVQSCISGMCATTSQCSLTC